MTKRGRPSRWAEDLPRVLNMIERWRPDTSASSLATYELKFSLAQQENPQAIHPSALIPAKSTPKKSYSISKTSMMKRLEVKFNELLKEDWVLPISVYLNSKPEMYLQCRKLGISDHPKPENTNYQKAESEAHGRLAIAFCRPVDEVPDLIRKGQIFLDDLKRKYGIAKQ